MLVLDCLAWCFLFHIPLSIPWISLCGWKRSFLCPSSCPHTGDKQGPELQTSPIPNISGSGKTFHKGQRSSSGFGLLGFLFILFYFMALFGFVLFRFQGEQMFLCGVVYTFFKSPFKPNTNPSHGCLQEILPWYSNGSSKSILSSLKTSLAVLLRRNRRNNQLLYDTLFSECQACFKTRHH